MRALKLALVTQVLAQSTRGSQSIRVNRRFTMGGTAGPPGLAELQLARVLDALILSVRGWDSHVGTILLGARTVVGALVRRVDEA